MAENSKIQWTDHTFNPWSGCSKVHAGCANCYAEVNYSVKMRGVQWGKDGTRVRTANWSDPLKWNRQAACIQSFDCNGGSHSDACPQSQRPRVFCASLADVFEDWQGPILNHKGDVLTNATLETAGPQSRELTMADLRRDLFALIDATPNLDWLLLTKRPENIARMWCSHVNTDGAPPSQLFRPNVWLGTSISDQATADKYLPKLLECRNLAPVLFASAEPLLGPIDLRELHIPYGDVGDHDQGYTIWSALTGFRSHKAGGWYDKPIKRLDWVIVGGESGHNARPCTIDYVDDLRIQCTAANVACFIKQLGAVPVTTNCNLWDFEPAQLQAWGDHAASARITLRDPKGGDWSEWPEDLRVRELPQVRTPGGNHVARP